MRDFLEILAMFAALILGFYALTFDPLAQVDWESQDSYESEHDEEGKPWE